MQAAVKAAALAHPELLERMTVAISHANVLEEMATHSFGNYVLQDFVQYAPVSSACLRRHMKTTTTTTTTIHLSVSLPVSLSLSVVLFLWDFEAT